MACVKYIKLNGKTVKVEGDSRVHVRRQIEAALDKKVKQKKINNFRFYQLKSLLAESIAEIMNRETKERGLTQNNQISKLFKELFFNPKSDENYLTTSSTEPRNLTTFRKNAKRLLSKEDFAAAEDLIKSLNNSKKPLHLIERIVSSKFKTKISAGRNGVYALLISRFHELGPNTKANQALLGSVFELLAMTDVLEEGKRNTVFDNPLVRDIFTNHLPSKGYDVTLETMDEISEDEDSEEEVIQSWQKEFHQFSTYDTLSERLKSVLNTLIRSKMDSNGNLIPIKNFINMKSTYPFGYVYSHLITLLSGSGSSEIMMDIINDQKSKDPIIAQLFPGDLTTNENQDKLGLVWRNIASLYKYDFKNVVSEEVSDLVGGKVISSPIMYVSSANFGNAALAKYGEILTRARQGPLVEKGTYKLTGRSNELTAKSFAEEVFDLNERQSEFKQEQELKDILIKYGFILESDKILVPFKDFHDAAKVLANALASKQDLLSIEDNSSRHSGLIDFATLLSKDSKLNTTHNNADGQKVHELNKSNAATRQISRIKKGKVDYSKDPLFIGNRVLEAIKESKVGYAILNGMKKFGSKYLTAYDKMVEQDLIANQLIAFTSGNTSGKYIVEMPIQADSGSMAILEYDESMIKKGKLKKGKYKPNESLIQDFIQLLRNEIASDKSNVVSEKNRGLIYFAEFNDLYLSGKLEKMGNKELGEKITTLLDIRYQDYRAYMRELGMMEKGEKGETDNSLYDTIDLLDEKDYYNFFYNYSYLYPSAAAIFNGHPNFYGKKTVNETLTQNDKRNKQNGSPSTPLRPGAMYTDSKGSVLTVAKTYFLKVFSEIYGTTQDFQKELAKLAKKDPANFGNVLKDFAKSTETDGQSFIDLYRLKAIDVSLGRWSDVKQRMYENLLKGNINLLADTNLTEQEREDLFNNPDAFLTSIKGFHFSMRNVNGMMEPFQKKDSEMVLIPAYGIKVMNGKPNPHYNAFYRYMMEKMGYVFSDTGVEVIPNFEEARSNNDGRFTDVFTFNSTIKTGIPTGQQIGGGTVMDITQEITFENMSVSDQKYANKSEDAQLEETFYSYDSVSEMPLDIRADFYEFMGIFNSDGTYISIRQIQDNISEFEKIANSKLKQFKENYFYSRKSERKIPIKIFNKILLKIFPKGDMTQESLDSMVDSRIKKDGKNPEALTSTERDKIANDIVKEYVAELEKDKELPQQLVTNYLNVFSHTPIVKQAIEKYGSKENLVADIVSQAKEQKGEAQNWWKQFVKFVLNAFSRNGYRQVLTDAFLQNKNLNGILYSESNIAPIDSSQTTNPTIMDVVNTLINSSTHLPFSNSDYYLRGKEQYLRVSNAISEFIIPEEADNLNAALKIGREIDRFVRDYLNGEVDHLDTYKIGNNKLMNSLIEQLASLKQEFDKRGEKVIAHEVTLHDDKLKIAGTTDILTYSPDGTFNVYDIKTMKGTKADIKDGKFIGVHRSGANKGMSSYETPYDRNDVSKAVKYKKQVNTYAMMLKNTFGITVNNMAVVPIVISYDVQGILDGKSEQVEFTQLINMIPIEKMEELEFIDGRTMKYGDNVTVFSADNTSTAIELSNEDYGVQQDTPVSLPGITKEFSKQTAKNGKANVDPQGEYKVKGLGTITGKKILQSINDIEIKMITTAYNKAVKKLGDTKSVVRMIKAEILKRGLSSNYLEALNIITDENGNMTTSIPLNFPAFSFKIKQILNSIFTKQVGKNKMLNGVSLINASSEGFNEQNRPKIIITDGKVDYVEAIIPIHDKRLIKYLKPNTFIGKEEMEQLVKENPELSEIFEGIVWRTPNESKYSTLPIKVIGVMPTEVASLIMLPVEVTTMVGMDFDIDKMFGFMYAFRNNINLKKGLEVIKKVLAGKRFNQKLKEKGLRVETYLQKLIDDSEIEQSSTQEETIVNMFNQGLLSGPIQYFLDKESTDFFVPRDESQEGLQNQLIDLYKGIFNSDDATIEMLNPSSNFVEEFQPFVDDLNPNIKQEVYTSPHRNAKARRKNLDGKALVGPFANINSIIAYLQQAKKLILQYNSKKGPIALAFKFNGKPFNNFTDITMKSGKYKFRSKQIGLWVAAIVDNAKHPFAGQLNINWSTIDMFMTGLLAGVELKTMIYFVNNPVVKSYSYYYKSKGNSRNATNAAIAATIDGITDRKRFKDGTPEREAEEARIQKILGRAYDFSDPELRTMAKGGSKQMTEEKQLQILGSLLQYNKYGEEMRKLVFMLKGSENGVGASDGDTIAHFLKLQEVDNLKYLEGAKEMMVDTSQPYYYLNALITGINNSKKLFSVPSKKGTTIYDTKSLKSSMSTLMKHLGIPDYSQGIFIKLINELNEDKKKIDGELLTAKDINLLLRDFTTYNFISRINPDGSDFLERFPDYFENKVSEHYAEFPELLDKFFTQNVQKSKTGMRAVFYSKSNNEISEENRYMESLMRSLYSQDKEFVQELAKYAVYKDGLGVSPFGFTSLIPVEAFKDIGIDKGFNEYELSLSNFNDATDLDVQIQMEHFKNQFILNNPKALSFVGKDTSKARGKNKKQKYLYNELTNELSTLVDGKYISEQARGLLFKRDAENIVGGRHFKIYEAGSKVQTKVPKSIEPTKYETVIIEVEEDVLKETIEYKILDYLKSFKLDTVSVKKETGFKVGTNQDVNPLWVKNNSGLSINQAAQNIAEDNPEISEEEAKDQIIEMLGYSPKQYENQLKDNLKTTLEVPITEGISKTASDVNSFDTENKDLPGC